MVLGNGREMKCSPYGAVRNRAGGGVFMETSADEVELNCFSKASHCGVSNQFLLYYMPHILIRINNLHDKQLNNYSSLYRVSLLKSMMCGDAVTGKEIYIETVGDWHAYTGITIPCLI